LKRAPRAALGDRALPGPWPLAPKVSGGNGWRGSSCQGCGGDGVGDRAIAWAKIEQN